jgi:hypothetical protein
MKISRATGLGAEPGSLLFPAAVQKTGKLSRRPLERTDAADMLAGVFNRIQIARTDDTPTTKAAKFILGLNIVLHIMR